MKGLELSKSYFYEYGLPMLEEKFKNYLDKMAIGLVGHGSECFGYDDEISLDHDYKPGFTIWISEDLEKEIGFKLFREYDKLPSEYQGVKVQKESMFEGSQGVHTINEFYKFYTGLDRLPETIEEWMRIPDFYLAEATNGLVFMDNEGTFTKYRNQLLNRPEDIRLKKLASAIFYMAQYGQYNYERCIKHNEKLAAANCLTEFAKNTAFAIYLLNKKYAPYYKWLFRGLRDLPILANIYYDLERLLENPYNVEENKNIIEGICKLIEEELRKEGLSDKTCDYIEPYAYCINNHIKDINLRTSPVML